MAVCVVHTICLSHRGLKNWGKILDKMTRLDSPSARPILLRHVSLMAITFVLSVSLHVGIAGYATEEFQRSKRLGSKGCELTFCVIGYGCIGLNFLKAICGYF